MILTPQDIQSQQFHVRFRGFDVEEVDTFLERVSEDLLTLMQENKQLKAKVEALTGDVEVFHFAPEGGTADSQLLRHFGNVALAGPAGPDDGFSFGFGGGKDGFWFEGMGGDDTAVPYLFRQISEMTDLVLPQINSPF